MTIPLTLLLVHFIADFVLQTNWMAINKSKRWDALTAHVFVYSFLFTLFWGVKFGAITLVTHWLTDYLTSRWTSRLWFVEFRVRTIEERALTPLAWWFPYFARFDGRKRHWFFVVVGFDQLIHFTTLALTYHYLFS